MCSWEKWPHKDNSTLQLLQFIELLLKLTNLRQSAGTCTLSLSSGLWRSRCTVAYVHATWHIRILHWLLLHCACIIKADPMCCGRKRCKLLIKRDVFITPCKKCYFVIFHHNSVEICRDGCFGTCRLGLFTTIKKGNKPVDYYLTLSWRRRVADLKKTASFSKIVYFPSIFWQNVSHEAIFYMRDMSGDSLSCMNEPWNYWLSKTNPGWICYSEGSSAVARFGDGK